MSIKEIYDLILLAVLVVGLLVLLFMSVLLIYKDEKKWRELRNKELKTRIDLMNIYIKRHTDND